MSVKRRDSKNRILQNGESQRKDGRYMYKYTDSVGKIKYLYSWRLVRTDPIPKGARDTMPLRDKIKMIQRDLDDGIVPMGDDLTVLELVEKYVAQKAGVRPNTEVGYRFVINILKKEAFGSVRIDRVKRSDARGWFIKLQKDGRGYSTIHVVRGVVKPAFEMAVEDDLLRKNPFAFPLTSVVINDSVKREALTEKQEQQFLSFIQDDHHFSQYYDAIYILFNTGVRISEFVGLTIADLDMDKGIISINHQLQKRKDNGKYVILNTKTDSGTRLIPMTDEVKACFARILKNRPKPKIEPMIDGKAGFLYLDRKGMPLVALHWEKYFQRIREKYNECHMEQMPLVTPHVCRHTFCSKMARAGMNPKTLQTVMGHSDIGITLNVYTHVDFDDVKREMQAICNC